MNVLAVVTVWKKKCIHGVLPAFLPVCLYVTCGFPYAQKSRTELFQKVCEIVEWGLRALEKDVGTAFPQDGSAFTDSVFMQVGRL